MTRTTATTADAGTATHTYRVVVEPDEDAWHAARHCRAMAPRPGARRGPRRVRHSREVHARIVAELLEDGETVPADEAESAGTLVPVTV